MAEIKWRDSISLRLNNRAEKLDLIRLFRGRLAELSRKNNRIPLRAENSVWWKTGLTMTLEVLSRRDNLVPRASSICHGDGVGEGIFWKEHYIAIFPNSSLSELPARMQNLNVNKTLFQSWIFFLWIIRLSTVNNILKLVPSAFCMHSPYRQKALGRSL